MHEHRMARLRLFLIATLAFGCSVSTLSGTLAAMSIGVPTAASPRAM